MRAHLGLSCALRTARSMLGPRQGSNRALYCQTFMRRRRLAARIRSGRRQRRVVDVGRSIANGEGFKVMRSMHVRAAQKNGWSCAKIFPNRHGRMRTVAGRSTCTDERGASRINLMRRTFELVGHDARCTDAPKSPAWRWLIVRSGGASEGRSRGLQRAYGMPAIRLASGLSPPHDSDACWLLRIEE